MEVFANTLHDYMQYTERMSNGRTKIKLISSTGCEVGHAILQYWPLISQVELCDMTISSDFRRRGIASAWLRRIVQETRTLGYSQLLCYIANPFFRGVVATALNDCLDSVYVADGRGEAIPFTQFSEDHVDVIIHLASISSI